MRKIIVSEFMTLDGVMEDPGGAEKTRHGGWSFLFWSEDTSKFKFDELFACDALLLGRVTYQGFAEAWPGRTDEAGFAERMNSLPKYVVSTTLATLEWNNSRLIKGNIAEEVAKMKQQPGQNILIAGSSQLVQSLMQENLIDEYWLMVYPIVLGSGKRLFENVDKKRLQLIETKTFSSGVILLQYQSATSNAPEAQ